MRYKTSVIIPIYNTEQYLDDCVQSVLNQTQKEYEIILIDDGSTDSSNKIACGYAKKYPNICLITQKNEKLGAARNRGLERAEGEYILFLDSDDMIEEKCLELLYKEAKEKELDLVTYDALVKLDDGITGIKENRFDRKNKIINIETIKEGKSFLNLYYHKGSIFVGACFSYIRNLYLKEKGIKFREGVFYEDVDYSLKIYLQTDRMRYYPEQLYIRRYRKNSIKTEQYKEIHVISAIKLNYQLLLFLMNTEEKYEDYICLRELYGDYSELLLHILDEYKKDWNLEIKEALDSLGFLMINYDMKQLVNKFGLEDIIYYCWILKVVIEVSDFDRKNLIKNRFFILKKYLIKIYNSTIKNNFFNMYFHEGKICIYGVGEITKRIIDRYFDFFPQINSKVVFADSYIEDKKKYVNKYELYNIKNVDKLKISCIFISSIRYENEMIDTIKKYYGNQIVVRTYEELRNWNYSENVL